MLIPLTSDGKPIGNGGWTGRHAKNFAEATMIPGWSGTNAKRVAQASGAALGFIHNDLKGAVDGYKTAGALYEKVNQSNYSQVKRAPAAAAKKGTGGVYKTGYKQPPIALPGMTPALQRKLKADARVKTVLKSLESEMRKPGGVGAIPGRFFAEQGLWLAAGKAHDMLLENRPVIEGMDTAFQVSQQIGSVVGSGLMYVNPVLGALAGPVIEGITQLALVTAKNNQVGGSMNLNTDPAEFKRYVDFVTEMEKQNKTWKGGITFDRWKEYDTAKKQETEEEEGGSCQVVTQAMLGDLSIEEYMEQAGIPKADPKKAVPEPEVIPARGTPEEEAKIEKDLADAFGPGKGWAG